MKMHKNKKHNKLLILLLLISIITYFIINFISKKITPISIEVSQREIDIAINDYIFNSFSRKVINNNLNDLIVINKNKKDEIISVRYNLPVAYEYLGDTLDKLCNNIKQLSVESSYCEETNNTFFIPFGAISSSSIFSKMGPKIPIKVDALNDVKMKFETSVSSYGMNNSLMEIYLNIKVENMFISPFINERKESNYRVLIGSQLIVGIVPSVYGGVINTDSEVISS